MFMARMLVSLSLLAVFTIYLSHIFLYLFVNMLLMLSFVCISGALYVLPACPDFPPAPALFAAGHTLIQKLRGPLHRPPSRSPPAL